MRLALINGRWHAVFESVREKRSILRGSQTAYFTKDGKRWVISGEPLSALSIPRKCHGLRVVLPKIVVNDIGDPGARGLETDHKGIVIAGKLVSEHGAKRLLVPGLVAKAIGSSKFVLFEPYPPGYIMIPVSGVAKRVSRRKRVILVGAPEGVNGIWVVHDDGSVILK